MAGTPELVELNWPRQGLVENSALMEQPEGTTTDALNVRAYDALDRRNRGGQRTGLARVIDAQVNGTADIQLLMQTVESVPLFQAAAVGAKFADPTSPPSLGNFGPFAWHPDGDFMAVASTSTVTALGFNSTTGFTGILHTTFASSISDIAWSPDGAYLVMANEAGANRVNVVPFDKSTGFGTVIIPSPAITTSVQGVIWDPDGDAIIYTDTTSPFMHAIAWTGTAFGTAYTNPTDVGISGGSNGAIMISGDGTFVGMGGSGTTRVRVWNWDSASGFGAAFTDPSTSVSPTCFKIEYNSATNHMAIAADSAIYVYPFSSASGWGASRVTAVTTAIGPTIRSCGWDGTGGFLSGSGASTPFNIVWSWDGSTLTEIGQPSTLATAVAGEIAWSPNNGQVGYQRGGTNSGTLLVYSFTASASNPSSRLVRLVTVAGGSVYRTDTNLTSYSLVNDGASAVKGSGLLFATSAFQNIFFGDGLESYSYYNLASNSMLSWRDALTAGDLPFGSTQTAADITAVNTGASTFTTASDFSGLVAGDIVTVAGSTGNDRNYNVVSASGGGPTTITVTETIADATADGTIQAQDEGALIIATYRGRVVLSGLRAQPQNWFMSAAGDPFDFDFFPTTTSATQAIAGNNSNAGQLGDIVTALAPYLDDLMIMGGANTLWVMRGDPAAGGEIDNVSREIGIVGPEAWTFDTGQRFYFFGRNGLYRMDLNSFQPQLISQNKLDNVFAAVDISTKIIRLVYDPIWQGVHIFISDENEPTTASRHFFYDERNDAFWPDEYPIAVGPSAVTVFLADDPEQTAVYLGGYDGRVRQFEDSTTDDDGTPISSFIRFSPVVKGGVWANAKINDLFFITDSDSNNVTFKMYAASTVEAAEALADANTPTYSKILLPGRNNPIRRRTAANAFIPEISQNGDGAGGGARWSYEDGGARIQVTDRVRSKGV